jgi:hypothetical protein
VVTLPILATRTESGREEHFQEKGGKGLEDWLKCGMFAQGPEFKPHYGSHYPKNGERMLARLNQTIPA